MMTFFNFGITFEPLDRFSNFKKSKLKGIFSAIFLAGQTLAYSIPAIFWRQ